MGAVARPRLNRAIESPIPNTLQILPPPNPPTSKAPGGRRPGFQCQLCHRPSPASSASVPTHTTPREVVTRPPLTSPMASRLPSILSSRPMAGPPGRTGEGGWGEDNGYSLFCFVLFFKEKYSLFQAYSNFQSAALLHSSVCLSVESTRLLGWAQKPLPCGL